MRISEVMIEEHARLTKMLLNLIKNIENKKEIRKIFIEFKWNLEKHFFIEEKAIFSAYGSKIEVGRKVVNLIEEHKEMLSILKEAEKEIDKGKFPDLSKFKKIMLRHQEIEDDYFYTGLENNLNEDLKAEILDKTSEIIKIS